MKVKLGDYVLMVQEREVLKKVDTSKYVSTENILADRNGVKFPANTIPLSKTITTYKKDDILISNIRPYFKKIWKAEFDGPKSNDVIAFRTKDSRLLQDYLYVVLQSDNFFNYVTNTAKGTKMPRGDKKAIINYEFELPNIQLQRKISHTILVLEKKIRLNNQINDNLVKFAEVLFSEEFNSNEEILLSNYLLPKRGRNLLKKNVIPGKFPVVAGGLKPTAFHNTYNTKTPVVTISASGANAGYVQIWGQPVWSSDSSYIDTTITKNVYFWYLLLKKYQKQIFDAQTGSAQPHIYPKHIGNLLIPNISENSIKKFNTLISPIFDKIFQNDTENNKLKAIKSNLLIKYFN